MAKPERTPTPTLNPDVPLAVSPEVAGQILGGVAPHTLANWRAAGKGPPYVKSGRTVSYLIEDLSAYLRANRRGGE